MSIYIGPYLMYSLNLDLSPRKESVRVHNVNGLNSGLKEALIHISLEQDRLTFIALPSRPDKIDPIINTDLINDGRVSYRDLGSKNPQMEIATFRWLFRDAIASLIERHGEDNLSYHWGIINH